MVGKTAETRYFERLTLNQRVQHMVLILSFTMLVVTGLPVRYPASPLSEFVIRMLGGFTMRSYLHRVGAILLIGLCLYHVCYTALSRRGRSEFVAFLPRWKDFTDLFAMLKHYFMLSPEKPRFDRFNYIEKFEYFAMGWGSAVMILSGFVLWFEEWALEVLPKWALDVARVIHSYEALLAFLAIIIWHFYHVHLKPEYFPMNFTWLNGKVSEDEMKNHHPLEYERLMASEQPGRPHRSRGKDAASETAQE